MEHYCSKCGAHGGCDDEKIDAKPVNVIEKKIDQAPIDLQSVLPKQAQQIYVETFNYAYTENSQKNGQTEESLMMLSHAAAFAEIDRRFEKQANGKWRAKKLM